MISPSNSNNLNKSSRIKTDISIAILVAVGVIFSIIDKQISILIFPFLPTAKIGLANVVILLGIVLYRFREAFIMTILKSLLVSLVFGSIVSFVIGFTASLFALLSMSIVRRLFKDNVSCINISVVGGFFHIVGQLLVTYYIYSLGNVVFIYGIFLVILSLITSIIVGAISNKLIYYIHVNTLI